MKDPDSSAALDPTRPIALTRRHEAGQRYAITMLHTGMVANAYDAEATVTSATPEEVQLALTIKSLTANGAPRLTDAAFDIKVYPGRRSVDAEQVSGPSGALYLTAIEGMLGALCWTPSEPHVPGDAWVDGRNASWQLVGFTARDGRNYVHYKGETGTDTSGRTYDLELAADDAYSGTCTIDTRVMGQAQRYQISVTRL